MCFCVFLQRLSAILSNQTMLGAISSRIFKNFAQIFRDFAQIFRDFAQISKASAQISDKSKLLRVRLHTLHGRRLHHCS